MELQRVIRIALRWWWIVVGVPLLVFAGMVWRTSDQPYDVSIRATILIPGDTEVPGSAERPELMVLDDGPPFIRSHAFADLVTTKLAESGSTLTVDDVKSSLSAERYSRILTIHATRDSAIEASAIAAASAAVLPDAVNEYLVAEGSPPATVRIIDPPGDPGRAGANRFLVIGVQTLIALVVAIGLAVAVDWLESQRRPPVPRS